jgi:C4-type Zn-finger protein
LTPEQYVCENCGYKGPVVMEIEEEGEQRAA